MFEKYSKVLAWIGRDKVQHFCFGALIAVAACAGSIFAQWSAQTVCIATASSAIIAGIVKEILDDLANLSLEKQGLPPVHDVDMMDAIATAFGGVYVCVAFLIANCVVRLPLTKVKTMYEDESDSMPLQTHRAVPVNGKKTLWRFDPTISMGTIVLVGEILFGGIIMYGKYTEDHQRTVMQIQHLEESDADMRTRFTNAIERLNTKVDKIQDSVNTVALDTAQLKGAANGRVTK